MTIATKHMSASNTFAHPAETDFTTMSERSDGLSNELRLYCGSDLLSEEGLGRILEQHGLTPPNSNVGDTDYYFFLEACANENVTEGMIQCLLEYFPAAAYATDGHGRSPIQYACQFNQNVTLNIIRLLIDAAPDSVRCEDEGGQMPLHTLCDNSIVDEATAIEILKLLIEKYPEAVQHARHFNGIDHLPIHIAAGCGSKSPEFCRLLIEEYPGSEQMTDSIGTLPLHHACRTNSLDAVEYLLELHSADINRTNPDGMYPIHYAIAGFELRDNPAAAVEIVSFLLDCNSNVNLRQFQGWSLLQYACELGYDDSNIRAALQMITVIFDAHPEDIEDNNIASNIHRFHKHVQSFIIGELTYSRQAKDHRLMTTLDSNGQLPLHTALQNNVRLGSLKLLVKGNPSALRLPENNFAMPLHIACEHHDSASVVKYLLSLDEIVLDAVDKHSNTALHYACRGAKYDTIALLLESFGAVSVSKQNADKKLPIDLLWESDAVEGRESIEYTESVYQLVKAYPETVMSIGKHEEQPASTSETCSSVSGRKRKLRHD